MAERIASTRETNSIKNNGSGNLIGQNGKVYYTYTTQTDTNYNAVQYTNSVTGTDGSVRTVKTSPTGLDTLTKVAAEGDIHTSPDTGQTGTNYNAVTYSTNTFPAGDASLSIQATQMETLTYGTLDADFHASPGITTNTKPSTTTTTVDLSSTFTNIVDHTPGKNLTDATKFDTVTFENGYAEVSAASPISGTLEVQLYASGIGLLTNTTFFNLSTGQQSKVSVGSNYTNSTPDVYDITASVTNTGTTGINDLQAGGTFDGYTTTTATTTVKGNVHMDTTGGGAAGFSGTSTDTVVTNSDTLSFNVDTTDTGNYTGLGGVTVDGFANLLSGSGSVNYARLTIKGFTTSPATGTLTDTVGGNVKVSAANQTGVGGTTNTQLVTSSQTASAFGTITDTTNITGLNGTTVNATASTTQGYNPSVRTVHVKAYGYTTSPVYGTISKTASFV